MISTLFVMTGSGEVIIEKRFNQKFPRSALEDFWQSYVSQARSIHDVPSIVHYSRYVYIHIMRGDVVFLAVSAHDVPPMMVIEVLGMVASTLSLYLKELTEDTLRENFSIVYQVLEELIDNGYPLTTEKHLLEELVPPPTLENKFRAMLDAPSKRAKSSTEGVVSWRNPSTKYSNNEIFFDLVENLDFIIDAEGNIVRSGVRGAIEVVCRLSGMPDIVLHLHNSEIFEDVSYHKCVRHARYESDRSVSFVPPDGKFTLFQYRCKPFHSLQPPFYVTPQITFSREGGRINVIVGMRHTGITREEREREIQKLVISIPLPPLTDSVAIQACSHGNQSFDSNTKLLTWRIGTLNPNSTPSLSGEFSFSSTANLDDIVEGTGESVMVDFQMPNFAVSGVRIDSVTMLNESYKPFKGVKYMTKAGKFTIRTV